MTFESLPELPLHRRWWEQIFPGPVVVALIQRQTADSQPCYLLIQRNSDTYSGQWALVGGKWDFGETLTTAVTREVKEETGLDATFVALRGLVSERLLPLEQENVGAHFLIFVCELAAADGLAREQEEGAVAWFTRAQIDQLNDDQKIVPSDFQMIQQFARATESIPHVEAEMLASIGTDKQLPARLVRFERIVGPEKDG